MKLAEKDRCYGCGACAAVCPKTAISMRADEEGFLYPHVDGSLCVECEMCERACPVGSQQELESGYPQYYALKHKSLNVLKQSSSGGAFTAISDQVLLEKGKVYGAEFNERFEVIHCVEETVEGRNRMRGSKYVQSVVAANVYHDLADACRSGRKIVFSGTPCQCAAVRKYLKSKNINQDNVIFVDLICHGATSPRIWADLVNNISKNFGEICYLNLRSKERPYSEAHYFKVETERGDVSEKIQKYAPFYPLYSSLCMIRPSCYQCPYSSLNRPGDFTIGDFEALKRQASPFFSENGVSTVLINSQKGSEVFEKIASNIEVLQVTLKEAWQQNLECPTRCPTDRKTFWNTYHSHGIEAVIKKYGTHSFARKIIFKVIVPICKKTGLYNFAIKIYMKR